MTVTAAEAEAFANAIAPGGCGVPLIFPIRFLALPEIHAVLANVADMARHIVLHEAQSFTVASRMQPGIAYLLTATLTLGAESQSRIVIEASIDGKSGTHIGKLRATVRLLPLAAPT